MKLQIKDGATPEDILKILQSGVRLRCPRLEEDCEDCFIFYREGEYYVDSPLSFPLSYPIIATYKYRKYRKYPMEELKSDCIYNQMHSINWEVYERFDAPKMNFAQAFLHCLNGGMVHSQAYERKTGSLIRQIHWSPTNKCLMVAVENSFGFAPFSYSIDILDISDWDAINPIPGLGIDGGHRITDFFKKWLRRHMITSEGEHHLPRDKKYWLLEIFDLIRLEKIKD